MHSLITVTLTACITGLVQAGSVCYGPNGNEDSTLGVCDASTSMSACCQWGDECYSNGLCQNPNVTSLNDAVTIYGIRGCTTAGGSTGECLPFAKCAEQGVGVTYCGHDGYCCYGTQGCNCNDSTQVFSLAPGKILTTLSKSAAAASVQANSVSSTLEISVSVITTSSTVSTTSSLPTANPSSTNNIAVGAGVGAGIGVAVLFVVSFGFWFWHKKRNGSVTRPQHTVDDHAHRADYKYGSSAFAPSIYKSSTHPPAELAHEGHVKTELDAAQMPVQLPSGESASTNAVYKSQPIELA